MRSAAQVTDAPAPCAAPRSTRPAARPLRVAVVAPLVAPLAPALPYGNQVLLVDLARALAARGHRVTVYAAEGSRDVGVRTVTVRVDAEARGAFVLLGRAERAAAATRRSFARVADAIAREGADVVSAHAFDAEAIELLAPWPTLHTLHLPPTSAPVVRAALRAEAAGAAAFAAVSRSCARAWRDAGLARVVALPNGVPALADDDAGDRAIEPIALLAGRIAPEKGTDAGVRAARAAGLAPRVVGEPYDAAWFARAVAPLLRPGELLGAMRREDVRRSMARAAVTLMPIAWEEPFGLVAAEAQLAGCPVVAYRRGALPEIVEDGVTGVLVPPGDEAALARAIAPALRLDRGAIRARARARLGMEACVDRHEAALARVARRLACASP